MSAPAPAPTRIVALAWRKSFPRQRIITLLDEAIRACPLGEAGVIAIFFFRWVERFGAPGA